MNWADGWSAADRAVAALSSWPPRRIASLPPNLYAVAARERTAAWVAHNAKSLEMSLPPEFELTSTTILARYVLAQSQTARILRALGPDVIPLKGTYLAEHIYPRPGLRDMSDIDLLVRREDVRRADKALWSLGWRPIVDLDRLLTTSGGYLNSCAYHGDGLQVHLHWHLVNASLPLFMYADRISLAEVWEESAPVSVAGAPCRAMSPHHLLVSLCEHALKHSFDTLIHIVDVALLWPRVDPVRACAVACDWGVKGAVYFGLMFARGALGLQIDGEVLKSLNGRPLGITGRWLVQRLRRNRRGQGLSALGFLTFAEGWRSKLRFLRESLHPPALEVEAFGKRPGARNLTRRTVLALLAIWEGWG